MFQQIEPETTAPKSVWEFVSHSPVEGLWDLRGVPAKTVAKRVWNSTNEDNLFGRASQLAYYFLFALFPLLIAAASILGLAAKSATAIYIALINRVATLIPPSALGIVLETFNQTMKNSTPGKITVGLLTALWSASVGVSAVQDTLNAVYKVKEKRSYWKARWEAILLTVVVSIIFTLSLATLLGCDVGAKLVRDQFWGAVVVAWATRILGWVVAAVLIVLVFSLLYYFSPDLQNRKWRWFTPGTAIALFGWILGSLGLRLYLHWFNSFSATYGSLGAVIILLTWFYLTGLMLLLGAEVNSEIEAAVAEQCIMDQKVAEGTVVRIDEAKTA